ncbi:MAG TPA: amino acid ABC transporter permease [Alphaproteobacteria bacterium]|nr:amino acid ABC transporter permease [Alphaproteobacteria bacterium]
MAIQTEAARRPSITPFWYDQRIRGVLFQVFVLGGLIAFIAFIIYNTTQNLQQRGIASGFGFLWSTSGFDISFSLISYKATDTYGRVLLVGILNTLFVSVLGVIGATVLGVIVGILRLSRNWLVARLATVYVEMLRNVPLLLQIVFWYFAVLASLPDVRQSSLLWGAFSLNQRGFYLPAPILEPGFSWVPVSLLVAIGLAFLIHRWAKRRQAETGLPFPTLRVNLAILILLPVATALLLGVPWTLEHPELAGFNYRGGTVLVPEFLALLFALVLYTASFIAEIVRAGILSVSHGQTEAALALGLRHNLVTRLVVMPQALRVIVPPLTSQYLNLTKNSSLAVAIAYPDLFAVFAGTTLNQTGQAIETIAITMLVYTTISLGISAFMNWYNRKIALVER